MSETLKPDAMFEERNIAGTPEQAINAATNEDVAATATSTSTEDAEATAPAAKQATRSEITERLKAIADSDDALNSKAEVEMLKIQFYKLRSMEIEALRKEFIDNGGNAEEFTAPADQFEAEFKETMNIIKEKRNAWLQQQAA